MGRLTILHHDELVPAGLLETAIRMAGLPVRHVFLSHGDALPSPAEISGLVSLGGHMGAYQEEAYPFLAAEKSLLREATARSIPVLGLCLGCQILAEALGGRAYPAPGPEIGLLALTLTEAGTADPVVGELTGPVLCWHHDTWDLPPGARLLAASERHPQAFRLGSALGLQFHPEADGSIVAGWIERSPEALTRAGVDGAVLSSDLEAHRETMRLPALRLFAAWLAGLPAPGR